MNFPIGTDDPDVDPIYKMFLDNLREDGKSYIFETADDHNCSPMHIKYEEAYQPPNMPEHTMWGSSRTPEMGKPSRNSKINHLNRDFHANLTYVASLSEDESVEDESFKKFLDHVRIEGGFVVLDCKPGIFVKYEEPKRTSAASQDLQTTDTLFPGEKELLRYKESSRHGVSPVKEHESNSKAIVSGLSDETFHYKQNLLEVLNKPFDHNEYDDLLKEATERKPLTKQKHLRGMSISYSTSIPGMSYFDHHPDLARQFEGADCYRGLALLRGFFFWLKNLCHEGSFMPWTSSNAEMLSTTGYEIMLPLDDSPINEIRDPPVHVALENELTEDKRAGDLLLESGSR